MTMNTVMCIDAAISAMKTAGGGTIALPPGVVATDPTTGCLTITLTPGTVAAPPGTLDVATTIGHIGISIAEVVVDLLVIYGALACVVYAVAAFMMWPRRPGKLR
jgi:ethanolamine utilization microcompartment shell protein EutS